MSASKQTILSVEHLKKYFQTASGQLHAVDDINFTLAKGETLGVVGESGCGKSTLGRTILRLHEPTDGKVIFDGKDVTACSKQEMKKLREDMQIIFQDPFASINPRMTVSQTIAEPLLIQGKYKPGDKEALNRHVRQVMDRVGLAQRLVNAYPHELDGGRRQRIGIGRALALEPMFITHDLSVVKHLSNQIMVMYLGQVVEICDAKQLFRAPVHPYTKALLSAIPIPDPRVKMNKIPLKGELSSPINPKPGCRFAKRCPYATPECTAGDIPLCEIEPGHSVACIKAAQFKDAMA